MLHQPYGGTFDFEYNAFTVYCSWLILFHKRRSTLEAVCCKERRGLAGEGAGPRARAARQDGVPCRPVTVSLGKFKD